MSEVYAFREWNVTDEANGDKLFARCALLSHSVMPENIYFSLQGSLRDNKGRELRSGQIREDIIRLIPETKRMAQIHLSDRFGVPMHAYANAAWWAGHGVKEQRNLPRLSQHLRALVSHCEIMVLQIDEKLRNVPIEKHYGEATEFWKVAVREHKLLDRWHSQAREVLSQLKTVKPLP